MCYEHIPPILQIHFNPFTNPFHPILRTHFTKPFYQPILRTHFTLFYQPISQTHFTPFFRPISPHFTNPFHPILPTHFQCLSTVHKLKHNGVEHPRNLIAAPRHRLYLAHHLSGNVRAEKNRTTGRHLG